MTKKKDEKKKEEKKEKKPKTRHGGTRTDDTVLRNKSEQRVHNIKDLKLRRDVRQLSLSLYTGWHLEQKAGAPISRKPYEGA